MRTSTPFFPWKRYLARASILCLLLFSVGCFLRPQPAPQPTIDPIETAAFPTFPAGEPPVVAENPLPAPSPMPTGLAPTPPRVEISLDGAWEMVRVRSLTDPIPSAGWEPFQAPGILDGYNYERAWFQRRFSAPAGWSGSRFVIHFNGVKYNSRIFVNQQPVGEYFNGYDAFDVDITAVVKPGEDNLLQVGVQDWTGVFSAADVNLTPFAQDWEALRSAPRDRILSPIGGLFTYYGIWDSVSLQVMPQARIAGCAILANVSTDRLDLDLTLRNEGTGIYYAPIEVRIYPWNGAGRDAAGQWETSGDPVAFLPPQSVTVPAGRSRVVRLSIEKPGLALWSPNQPNLYILEIAFLQPGGDVWRERFGWREFRTSGGDFYLNGSKVHLLAASWWPDGQRWTRDQVIAELRATRAANVIAFRTHTQPWPEVWYEAADEVGMMMIPEGAVWNDDLSYRIDDETFWRNYTTHLEAMVNHLRNHASIVMWSLENELSGTRINDQTPAAESRLAQLGLRIRQLDSTRPITYESDGDPGGVANVIGLHYPNEYPQVRLWPAAAYWLDQPREIFSGGGFFWDDQPFFWDRRKPLYIGEYLWSPSQDPSTHTLFTGDRAYASYETYAKQAKVIAWRMQMQAYRTLGVSGHSPWAVKEEGKLDQTNPFWVATRDLYRPLAAFLRDPNVHFFSGDTIPRRVTILNDTLHDLPQVTFAWALYDGKNRIAGEELQIFLASGDQLEQEIKLTMPQVSQRKRLTLRLVLSASGEQRFVQDYRLDVFPRRLDLAGIKLALYDPQGTLEDRLNDGGAAVSRLSNLRDWNGQDLLVVGPGALRPSVTSTIIQVGASDPDGAWLRQQIAAGGRVLFLEQTPAASSGFLPLRLSDQQSTLAFIQAPNHPILADLSDEDLRWWGSDQLVSVSEPFRASQAGIKALVVTGGAAGISHSPLTEIQEGSGVWLVCQLRVASKLRTEPVAQVLLERMLGYLASYTPPAGKVVYYPPETDLSQFRVNAEPLTGWNSLVFPSTHLLILSGPISALPGDDLRRFLLAGGSILWDHPGLNSNALLDRIGSSVQVQPWEGTALRAESNYALLDTLTREDLYWLGGPARSQYEPLPLAPNASAIFIPAAAVVAPGSTTPAAKGVTLSGDQVVQQGTELAFYANGSASWQVTLPQDGRYQFILLAYGAPANAIYPLVQVKMDGAPVGMIVAGSLERTGYRLFINARKGKHTFSVEYINDEYIPPEDRNLFIASYQVSPSEELTDLENLASPPALVRNKIGAGSLVLSSIEWNNAGQNSQRGQRYFAGLLSGLRAPFAGGSAPQVIEAETMRLPSTSESVMINGQLVAFFGSGSIEEQIQIVQPGDYRISVLGKGSPVAGIYPTIQIALDGQSLGFVELNSSVVEPQILIRNLPEGTFSLRLAFTNDAWAPETGEDRNAWIDRIEFEPLQ